MTSLDVLHIGRWGKENAFLYELTTKRDVHAVSVESFFFFEFASVQDYFHRSEDMHPFSVAWITYVLQQTTRPPRATLVSAEFGKHIPHYMHQIKDLPPVLCMAPSSVAIDAPWVVRVQDPPVLADVYQTYDELVRIATQRI